MERYFGRCHMTEKALLSRELDSFTEVLLKRTVTTKDEKEEKEAEIEKDVCIYCNEKRPNFDKTQLSCTHYIHTGCLYEFIEKKYPKVSFTDPRVFSCWILQGEDKKHVCGGKLRSTFRTYRTIHKTYRKKPSFQVNHKKESCAWCLLSKQKLEKMEQAKATRSHRWNYH